MFRSGGCVFQRFANTLPFVHSSPSSRGHGRLRAPQYVQWYKVLCWLLIMVIGGADGLHVDADPLQAREAARAEAAELRQLRAALALAALVVPAAVASVAPTPFPAAQGARCRPIAAAGAACSLPDARSLTAAVREVDAAGAPTTGDSGRRLGWGR